MPYGDGVGNALTARRGGVFVYLLTNIGPRPDLELST